MKVDLDYDLRWPSSACVDPDGEGSVDPALNGIGNADTEIEYVDIFPADRTGLSIFAVGPDDEHSQARLNIRNLVTSAHVVIGTSQVGDAHYVLRLSRSASFAYSLCTGYTELPDRLGEHDRATAASANALFVRRVATAEDAERLASAEAGHYIDGMIRAARSACPYCRRFCCFDVLYREPEWVDLDDQPVFVRLDLGTHRGQAWARARLIDGADLDTARTLSALTASGAA